MKYINLLYHRLRNFYKKYFFEIKLIIVIVLSFIMFLYGKIKIKEDFTYNEIFTSSSEGGVTDKIQNQDVIEQQFFVSDNSVRGVAVCFATYNTDVSKGVINAKILDDSQKLISEIDIDATYIKDNEYLDILFKADDIHKKQVYTLKLTFDKIENESIVCRLSENNVYPDYSMKMNGIRFDSDIVLREISAEKDIFYILYIGIISVFLGFIILFYFAIYKYNMKISTIYLIAGIFFGILYITIIPLFAAPDEWSHANSAYEVSNHILGIQNSSDGTIVMRKDDAESEFISSGVNRDYYNNYFIKLKNPFIINDELVVTENKPVSTYSYFYFISGLGVTFGRFLHLNSMIIFLMGRLCNLGIFILAVYYAIKKIPFGKSVIFLWALLPMTLQQTISYSYDSLILSLCVVIIALSINLAYVKNENLKKSQWIILYVCVILLVPAKGFALLPICILPLIIYFKKYREGRKILYYTFGLIIGIFIIIFLLQLKSILSNYNSIETAENMIEWANEPGYTIGYLLKHPRELFMILGNTICTEGDFYFKSFLGSSLGWFEINIPFIFVLPYFIMLIIAGIRKENEPLYLSKRAKVYLCFLAISGIGIACIGMLLSWTPISFNGIAGVQGRYFLPFVILLFLCIRSNMITMNIEAEKKLLFSSIWLEMIVCVLIYIRAV